MFLSANSFQTFSICQLERRRSNLKKNNVLEIRSGVSVMRTKGGGQVT